MSSPKTPSNSVQRRFTCPFGCNVSYSRERDLRRRHLDSVHGSETSERSVRSKVKRNESKDLQYGAFDRPAVGQPYTAGLPSPIELLGGSTIAPLRQLMPSVPETNVLAHSPQSYGDGSPPMLRAHSLNLIPRYSPSAETQLLELALKLEYSHYELRLAKSQLETERASRGLLEAQLQTERENTQCLFGVLRKSRNI